MMTDEEFVKRFEECTLAEFHHADHIRMAWLYLRKFGYEIGSRKVKEGIRAFAAAKNQNQLYHETITEFWIRLVQHVIASYPHLETFAEFFAAFPPLQNSKSIYSHYRKDFLMSENVRREWHYPDILAFR
jgi:hypothetical protein